MPSLPNGKSVGVIIENLGDISLLVPSFLSTLQLPPAILTSQLVRKWAEFWYFWRLLALVNELGKVFPVPFTPHQGSWLGNKITFTLDTMNFLTLNCFRKLSGMFLPIMLNIWYFSIVTLKSKFRGILKEIRCSEFYLYIAS